MEKVLIKQKQGFGYRVKTQLRHSTFLIIMIIPAIVYYVLFCYVPMYGVLIAFTEYDPSLGIMGSIANCWIGFDNFKSLFEFPDFKEAFLNTLLIGSIKVVVAFVSAVTVALLINELRMRFFKKLVQIIVTFPHFLSWVVVASIFMLMFSESGSINHLIEMYGGSKIHLFADGKLFLGLLFSSDIWKEAGWSAIIYIATMAGISPDLYEAADIDGATRLQKIWHITLPGIKPTAILLLIMSVGGVLSAGFDQIFNLTGMLNNGLVIDYVNIIDTLVYQACMGGGGLDSALTTAEGAALGLFKSVFGFVLVIITDRIAKAFGERGII